MKKISILLISILLLTGCGKKPEVINKNTTDENIIQDSVDETISKKDNIVYYDYSTKKYDISVKLKYDDKYFTLGDKYIKCDDYYLKVNVEEYKFDYYDSFKEIYKDNLTKIDNREALVIRSDISIIVMIKIDDSTIVNLSTQSDTYALVDDIEKDTHYKDLLKNIKITVKEK